MNLKNYSDDSLIRIEGVSPEDLYKFLTDNNVDDPLTNKNLDTHPITVSAYNPQQINEGLCLALRLGIYCQDDPDSFKHYNDFIGVILKHYQKGDSFGVKNGLEALASMIRHVEICKVSDKGLESLE